MLSSINTVVEDVFIPSLQLKTNRSAKRKNNFARAVAANMNLCNEISAH